MAKKKAAVRTSSSSTHYHVSQKKAPPVSGGSVSTPPSVAGDVKPIRSRTMAETMDMIAGITDDTDTEELWTEGMRDIDAQRPPGRKLFEGMD